VFYRKHNDRKFFCHEDDEAQDDAVEETRMVSETEMNKIMAAREKRMMKQFEKQLSSMNYASSDQLSKIVEDLESKSFAGAKDTGPVESNSKTSDQDKSDVPSGFKAELSKVQKQLSAMQEDNKRLQEEAMAKEQAMLAERRQHNTESLLSGAGAVRPEQCYTILRDKIFADDEIGDAISVKTELGEDTIPVKDYIDTFKEENPHLFTNPAKSGSGAGGGSSLRGKKTFSAENLSSPELGGMSWADYEKNRDDIIADLENNKRKR
jgi:mevalonate kinase